MKTNHFALLLCVVLLVLVTPSWADPISFDFSTFNNSSGATSATFTAGPYTLVATGYTYNWYFHSLSETPLHYTSGSGLNGGLGLTNYNNQQIGVNQFIQLDLGSMQFHLVGVIGSIQCSDAWSIWGSQSADCWRGNNCALNTMTGTASTVDFTPWNGDRYINIGASSGGVLINSLTTDNPVPEPSTIVLLITGLAAMSTIIKKRMF